MEIRIYGKALNIWKSLDENGREIIVQKEIEYKSYDMETFELIGIGSEDFSPEAYKHFVSEKILYTWDGKRINKGGNRWFDYRGIVKFRTSERKQVLEFLKRKYEAEVAQLR